MSDLALLETLAERRASLGGAIAGRIVGQTSAVDATVQVMILPTLILFWGVAVVIIAALV